MAQLLSAYLQSYIVFIGLSALFLTGALSQGILISIIARSQLIASQLAALSTLYLPYYYQVLYIPYLTYLNLSSNYILGSREVLHIHTKTDISERGRLSHDWQDAMFLGLFGAGMFMLSLRKFKKKVAI